jgi:hypothetical protein
MACRSKRTGAGLYVTGTSSRVGIFYFFLPTYKSIKQTLLRFRRRTDNAIRTEAMVARA